MTRSLVKIKGLTSAITPEFSPIGEIGQSNCREHVYEFDKRIERAAHLGEGSLTDSISSGSCQVPWLGPEAILVDL